ncbi:MAG: hypothetical protein CMI18_04450 [Opitutaceae bacterium]|nr:hypothetical protein [Opitutaceae bacterium]
MVGPVKVESIHRILFEHYIKLRDQTDAKPRIKVPGVLSAKKVIVDAFFGKQYLNLNAGAYYPVSELRQWFRFIGECYVEETLIFR